MPQLHKNARIRNTSVALPLEGDKLGQVVVQAHAVAWGVAPVVHFERYVRFQMKYLLGCATNGQDFCAHQCKFA